jgi:hypothetical protein
MSRAAVSILEEELFILNMIPRDLWGFQQGCGSSTGNRDESFLPQRTQRTQRKEMTPNEKKHLEVDL